MDNSTLKSNVELVFSVLNTNRNQFLSISEIIKILFEDYCTNMNIQTVVNQLDKIKTINSFFQEKIERRGIKNIPTRVFAIVTFNHINNEN